MYQLRKVTAAGAAVIMAVCGFTASAIGQNGLAPGYVATLTGLHGAVLKQDFVNREDRAELGSWKEASLNDNLAEGMRVATGKDSWAEVTWPHVKTRAWSNSVFSITPSQRLIYLTSGEMLFQLDKHRPDSTAYKIQTKVLQARIRGTTVLVQAKDNTTRITVLEGKIDIENLRDKSLVTITPGVVYEVKGFNMPATTERIPNVNNQASIPDISYDSTSPVRLFDDNLAATKLYAANRVRLIHHPLVNLCSGPICSLPLIETELRDVPGYSVEASGAVRLASVDNRRLGRICYDSCKIVKVPSRADYSISDAVNKNMKLPPIAYTEMRPTAVTQDTSLVRQAVVPVRAQAPSLMPLLPGGPCLWWNPAAQEEAAVRSSQKSIQNDSRDGLRSSSGNSSTGPGS